MALALIDTDRAYARDRLRALQRGEVHVWRLPVLLAQDAIDAENWWLDTSERERAISFLFAKDRLLYVSAHAWLRRILATYLGLVHPAAVRCERQAGGKPRLEAAFQRLPALLHFSMAHTHGAIAVGLAMGSEIGVDIERVRPMLDIERMYPAVLHDDEMRALQRMPVGEQETTFYRLWTIKEAYTKALGAGLSHPFPSVTVAIGGDSSFTLRDLSRRCRTIQPLTGYTEFLSTADGTSYAMAAAVLGSAGAVVVHTIPDGSNLAAPLSSAATPSAVEFIAVR